MTQVNHLDAKLHIVYGTMNVLHVSAHRLFHVGRAIRNNRMASFNLDPKFFADFIKPIEYVDASVSFGKMGSRQDKVVPCEVVVKPMS